MLRNSLRKIALISANVSKGQGKRGTELGPSFVKGPKLLTELRNLNYEPIDYATVDDVAVEKEVKFDRIHNLLSIAKTNHKISELVNKSIKDGHIPVVIGGDHSVGLGSLHGSLTSTNVNKQPTGVIWIDAHGDINTPLSTYSGNFHGQPVSFLLKEMKDDVSKVKEFDWVQRCLSAQNLVYIGLRDIDPDEVFMFNKYKIKTFSMTDIDNLGIKEVIKQTLDHLTINGNLLPLHVSVDIDSLDPWFAPSTGTPVLGGLTLRELMHIGNSIHKTGKLKSLDLVEVNPLIKINEQDVERTVFSAIRTIISFFGYNTIGTHAPDYQLPKPKSN